MSITAPRRFNAAKLQHRFSDGAPESYSAAEHSCLAILSTGAPVKRVYGTETLEISDRAINLSRVPVALLDSHSQASIDSVLGRIESAWVAGGKLHGKIIFAQTPRGQMAEQMVRRGEISSLSAGYSIERWEARDADGNKVDPDRAGWGDDLTFTATKWTLAECSLVGVPADALAMIRSLDGHSDDATAVEDARVRMMCRDRMYLRQKMLEAQASFSDTRH
jgi:phage head maturation protease